MVSLKTFGETAKGLARNPLGIIALFIVLIYGFASLVVVFSGNLTATERAPIAWFLVFFPVMVLGIFAWLVSQHHTKLYAPSDYKADDAFIRASQPALKAALFLGAARGKLAAQNPNEDVSPEEFASFARATAQQIAKASHHGLEDSIRKRVLWVDDRHDNNVFERQSLRELGIHIILASTTKGALEELSHSRFDAIISDMGRPPDQRAGYTLLEKLHDQDNQTPFIIYAGSRAPEHIAEAKEKDALGTTNRPEELFGMVMHAVGLE